MGVLAILLAGGPQLLPGAEQSASSLASKARKYEKKKDYANAYLYYSMAAAKDPSRREFWLRAKALQRRAIEKSGVLPQGSLPLPEAPADDKDQTPLPSEPDETDIREARKPQPPVELAAAPGEKDLDFRADFKHLWEEVGKVYGLQIVFDGDYEAGKVMSFHITSADYRAALHALTVSTASFFVPVSPNVLLVVKDTEAKRREQENTIALTIPIPDPVSIQEAQELARAVQQVMEIQRFAIDSARRVAILRDRVSKVRPAQMLFQQLLNKRAEVAVEVKLYAWSRSVSRTLGTNLPITSKVISPIIKTLTLAGGPLAFALGIGDALIVATAAKSEARLVFQAEMRSLSGEKASLLVGEKYPIQSVAYIGDTSSGGTVFTPPPSFTFEDLGFNVKLTPRVHDREEVSFEIDTEFKLLGAGSANGIPVISNRKFVAQVRLRFGESAVISGLVTRNDVRSLSGPAGLLSVPGLAALLGNDSRSVDDVELVLVMTPRLLSTPTSEFLTREIWVGSESRPRIPM